MRHIPYYIIALLTLFTSCEDAEYEYSNYPCNFVFNNTGSKSSKLAAAMNSASPGIFCRISASGKTFFFEINDGSGDKERVAYTAIDEQRTIAIGVYNESGIIVGYGNLNNPATFYAYDNQCPNCYEEVGLPRYGLTMDTSGKATCSRCNRSYDMNNGGIVASGDGGSKLIRYRASTTGPLGVISVVN